MIVRDINIIKESQKMKEADVYSTDVLWMPDINEIAVSTNKLVDMRRIKTCII